MKPSTRNGLIAVGLVAVALVWAGALNEMYSASDPPSPVPELAPSNLAVEVSQPGFESTRARGVASDDTSETDLATDSIDTEARARTDHRRTRATSFVLDPADARSNPELGQAPMTKAPSDSAPELNYVTEPDDSEISDGALRAAIDRWTGPEHCTAQVPKGQSGTVRVKVGFGRAGEAQALHPVNAEGPVARAYAACLQGRLTSLKLDLPPTRQASREATFVF